MEVKPKRTYTRKPKVVAQVNEETKEQQVVNPPAPETKFNVIIGIDPAFKKLGLGVINAQDGSYIDSKCLTIRPESKYNQSQVEGNTNKHIKDIMNKLYSKYNVEYVCIELQLGQMSCTPIQTAIVGHLNDNTKYTVQHSKLKLKHPEVKDVQAPNTESKKYNQNKMQGRLLAQKLFPGFQESNYDQCDGLLHALYGFRNKDTIQWITKDSIPSIDQ